MTVVAYFAGLLTLPALVALVAGLDLVRSGGWATPVEGCKHHGPGQLPWRWLWRCPDCGGLWARRPLARVLPRRLMLPATRAEEVRDDAR